MGFSRHWKQSHGQRAAQNTLTPSKRVRSCGSENVTTMLYRELEHSSTSWLIQPPTRQSIHWWNLTFWSTAKEQRTRIWSDSMTNTSAQSLNSANSEKPSSGIRIFTSTLSGHGAMSTAASGSIRKQRHGKKQPRPDGGQKTKGSHSAAGLFPDGDMIRGKMYCIASGNCWFRLPYASNI